MNSIQQYTIQYVGYLRQVSGFIKELWFPPPIQLTAIAHNFNEILKVTLKANNPNHNL
jgi:hypothetical protein